MSSPACASGVQSRLNKDSKSHVPIRKGKCLFGGPYGPLAHPREAWCCQFLTPCSTDPVAPQAPPPSPTRDPLPNKPIVQLSGYKRGPYQTDGRGHHWCFTLNNPLDFDAGVFDASAAVEWIPPYKYLVVGREVGESGTPHLQGYVAFQDQLRFNSIKSFSPQCAAAHWEQKSKFSTYAQAAEYCKKGGDFTEWGTLPTSGSAATAQRWTDALTNAREGKFEDIPAQIQIQCYRTLKSIRNDALLEGSQLDGELMNFWYHGPPGTGKSLYARLKYPLHFLKALNHWWDGYTGEEVVLLDEWELTSGKFLGHHLKLWTDRYPFRPEVKGGFLPTQRPKTIIITSNYSIDDCFGQGVDAELNRAIHRRFRSVDFGTSPPPDLRSVCGDVPIGEFV